MGQLRLAAVLAAADLAALGDVLCHRTDGLVFLLQALVAAPALVQARDVLTPISVAAAPVPVYKGWRVSLPGGNGRHAALPHDSLMILLQALVVAHALV